jgi:GDP-L-fucose synthase
VILVTGGNGLLGRALARVIARRGRAEHWVFASREDADLRIMTDVDSLFDRYQPTQVLHLAARLGGVYSNIASFLDACYLSTSG